MLECVYVCVCPCVCFVLTQAVRAVYGEAHEDDVSVWIGERSEPVIVFLTRSVPESQLHLTHALWVERVARRTKGMWRKRKGRRKKKEREKLIHHVHTDQQNLHVEASK